MLTIKNFQKVKVHGVVSIGIKPPEKAVIYLSIKNLLLPAIVELLKPIFDKLKSKEFLPACENVRMQNLTKCYRQVFWSLTRKD